MALWDWEGDDVESVFGCVLAEPEVWLPEFCRTLDEVEEDRDVTTAPPDTWTAPSRASSAAVGADADRDALPPCFSDEPAVAVEPASSPVLAVDSADESCADVVV
ncbi:MAG TPA: hypothetical protein VER34_13665 [Mycobacterium sp.]|nr:hypothetical protein [Mycobacterium sp.]